MNKHKTSSLVLEFDANWDRDVQIPLEPTRYGKVVIRDKQILHKYPIINIYLIKNQHIASYFSPATTKQRLSEKNHILTQQDHKLLKLANDFNRQKDKTTSHILSSLLFDITDYQSIEEHVHFRLSSSMLGPNPSVSKPITDAVLKYAISNTTKKDKLTIIDPFAGNGSLGLIVSERLIDAGITDFTIINNDLSQNLFQQTTKDLSTLVPDRLMKTEKYLKFVQGDGLSMNHIPNDSIDLIITLRALHEHGKNNVGQFFHSCNQKLKPGGQVIIDDVTREKTILNRAKKLLPLLGQMTAFRLITENKIVVKDQTKLTNLIINGDPYLSQAGVQSYISGYKISELIKIARQNNFETDQVEGYYDYSTPFPIGSMQLRLVKTK